LDCLRWYQREWDEKSQDFRNRPLHDWSSHGADAFRYLAMGINRISGESGFKKLKKRKNLRVC
jgi:hypothetical protein